MKTLLKYYASVIAIVLVISGCEKNEGPSVDDNFLNYTIEEIPVTADYTIGAFYYNISSFNANIKEEPVAGKYNMPNGVVNPAIMSKHIDDAVSAGLDYFVFSYRSPGRALTNFKSDSAVIRSFLNANSSSKMKFALAYNFSSGTFGITTANPIENDATKLEQFYKDFERIAPFLNNSNYMKVNGKPLLYITNSYQIYSGKDSVIYSALRKRMEALGFQLYLVGNQERWSPPARYPFRLTKTVDAVYHQSFVYQLTSWDRFYLLPQCIDQNWLYAGKYFADNYNIDYIPNISPAFNWLILNPTSVYPSVSRADSGLVYRQLCNVAKKNANPATRLILIDSWNDWQNDTQLEPARSYGDLYLNITREQFKVK